MKDLFPNIEREERAKNRDAQCGTCIWYDGIMDQCALRGSVRKNGVRCAGWASDEKAAHNEP